ncbi:MAG: fatty acid desaturase family protein, partial [Saprospiraceae bacterium]
MLQGKELILATRPYAQEQRLKSWFHALSTLTLLVGLTVVILMVPIWPVRIVSSIFLGLVIVRMFIIYHDYLHQSILQHSAFADAIMTLFGLYILAPKSIWKRSHNYHHDHNSKLFSASIGSYPIASKSKFLNMTPSERRAYLAIRHPLTITFGYITMFILGMCVSSFASSPRRHWDSLLALVLHAIFIVLVIVFFGWQVWLLAIFLPFLIAEGIGSYLFYAQHNFPGVVFQENADWTYEKAALESSSYMVTNPFMSWVTGNIGYHHIHHL